MFLLRLFPVLVSSLLFLNPLKGQEVNYVWKGSSTDWTKEDNWSVNGAQPSAAPGAAVSAYTHWMLTDKNSVGKTNIGGLAGGRYLKGIRVEGIGSPSGGGLQLFVLNSGSTAHLRVADGGITVENASMGGYNTDFGIARLRVAADQEWHVAEGRSFYVGRDSPAPSDGAYSLDTEKEVPYRVTLTGSGAVRIGKGMLLNNISKNIGFVMSAGKGAPTLDLTDHGMEHTITVEDVGRLEGMLLYGGSLVTRENAAVTFSETTAKASGQWSIGTGTSFALEDATLDLTDAGVDGDVTLSGASGITGGNGALNQTILDDARVTYTNRHMQAGEIRSVGENVTITLNNSSIHFDGEIPAVDLVVQGNCTLGGSGAFPGTITHTPGSSLAVDGDISLPSSALTLGRAHVSTLDGVPQNAAVQPENPSQQAREYVVLFDSSFEDFIASWPGRHTLGVQFKPEMTASITVKELPKGAVSWNYDEGSKLLTLQTDVAVKPEMPAGISGSKPNIIFVLVDDMGWGDLSVNWTQQDKNGREVTRSNSFKTPTLDTMAAEGMQLRRHYSAAPVCAPARASLLLGVHQGHSRVVRNNTFDYPIENSHTLGSLLKEAGYHTAAIGKWGIGGAGQSPKALTAAPHMRGFDYFYGIIKHLSGHFHYLKDGKQEVFEYDDQGEKTWTDISGKIPASAYDTDLFGARAKKWIMDHHGKTPNQPFFLYLAFPAPHGCLSAPACPYPAGLGKTGGLQWEEKDGYAASNTGAAGWSGVGSVPFTVDKTGEETTFQIDGYVYPEHTQFGVTEGRHATMIRRVDDVIKDVIQLLKDLNIDDNTMIVFTSDNGPHNEGGSGNYNNGAQNPSYFKSYGMMDGIKRDCWEGGMRVPTVVRWPGKIPSNGISLHACQFHDWMATFADAAGVPVPSRCDGVSLLPTLAGVPDRQRNGVIYAEYSQPGGSTPSNNGDFLVAHRGRGRTQQQIVFVDGFKGVRVDDADPGTDFEIYDTKNDPQEARNLASSRPDLQERMKAQALRMRRPSPTAVTNFDSGYIQPVAALSGLKEGGLRWRAWKRGFGWVPDFRQMEEAPAATGTTKTLDVLDVNAGFSGEKGVELTGYLKVPVTGEYTFYLQTDSNTGSKAFVHLHDMQLIDADYVYISGNEVASNAREGVSSDVSPDAKQPVKLTAGIHPIRIGYVGKTGASSLSMRWESKEAGIEKQDIPASAFSYEYVNPVNIDKTEETVGFAATTTTLTVQTQLPWTVSCDQPWVTVTPSSGAGTAVLDIAVEANGQQTERTALVTILCDGEERTFTLNQSGKPAPTGYDKWTQDHFGEGAPGDQTAPDACPAGDGITNLMKYATGLDPNKPCGSVTKLTIQEDGGKKYLLLSWPVNPEATDVTFSVESSSDLKVWTDEGTVAPNNTNGEFRDTVTVEESGPERRFLRLKVTR
ncbi:sulfatase-like hydrolase/transferase [Akkermansia sp.]|uniref:sulfatase-like hydrolase/transferase n=1 Tax=Akkermansia sp. TaxID=1872421 RepID=UPI0025BCED34|nr:sulfatase-like hydrolase/transferase [Akkermansia sp.]